MEKDCFRRRRRSFDSQPGDWSVICSYTALKEYRIALSDEKPGIVVNAKEIYHCFAVGRRRLSDYFHSQPDDRSPRQILT